MLFKIYHSSFDAILGESPQIDCLKEKDYPFSHEAGVLIDQTNELFIASNRLVDALGNQEVRITRVKLGDTAATTTCEEVECAEVVMANGGVNCGSHILFCAQAGPAAPSGLYDTPTIPPYATKLLVADFYGRPFNTQSTMSLCIVMVAYGSQTPRTATIRCIAQNLDC